MGKKGVAMVRTHKFSTGIFEIRFEEINGLCCYPESDDLEKSITISPRLRGCKKLDVIIHEGLHAEFPSLREKLFSKKGADEEEWVNAAAANISKLLWRMGYRLKAKN